MTSPPPFAGYTFSVSGDTVNFKALQFQNNVKYVWIFGDGSWLIAGDECQHIYGNKGVYLSGLEVEAKGSSNLVSQSILIK